MTFDQLKVGDTFDIETKDGLEKYIKIKPAYTDDNIINAVCIDEYSDNIGSGRFFIGSDSCS